MFYLNITKTSVKVEDIALALRALNGIVPLTEAIKDVKHFHKDMEYYSYL